MAAHMNCQSRYTDKQTDILFWTFKLRLYFMELLKQTKFQNKLCWGKLRRGPANSTDVCYFSWLHFAGKRNCFVLSMFVCVRRTQPYSMHCLPWYFAPMAILHLCILQKTTKKWEEPNHENWKLNQQSLQSSEVGFEPSSTEVKAGKKPLSQPDILNLYSTHWFPNYFIN